MEQRQLLLIILGTIIVGISIAIGITMFEEQQKMEAAKQERLKSLEPEPKAIQEVTPTPPPPEKAKNDGYYSAYDFNLIAGEVIHFSPNDEYITSLSLDEQKRIDIFIHIQPEGDSPVRVMKVPYATWQVLQIGAILK